MNLLDAYNAIAELNEFLEKTLNQQDVNYDITFGEHKYCFEATFTEEDKQEQAIARKKLIKALLEHHTQDIINHITGPNRDEHWSPANLIVEVLSYAGERPEDATLEIVSEEYEIGDFKATTLNLKAGSE